MTTGRYRHGARFLGVALLALVARPAAAQIGTGWTEYMPGRTLQTRGCGAHSGASSAVETFQLTCADTAGDNRAEDRMQDDYTAGTRQFQGEVRVVSLPGTNVSVKQTFMRDNGAFLMIGVAMNGRLYSVGDNGELATEVIGRWVRINTIHDVAAGTHQIYVEGVLKVTKTGARQVAWYNKYGSYRLGSGHGPITVEWRNTRFWKDGRGGAGAPPASADAGPDPEIPDAALAVDVARADAALVVDAVDPGGGGGGGGGGSASGGSGGAATEGMAGKSGGAAGTMAGRSGGAGDEGSPDADEEVPPRRSSRSSGCAVAGSSGMGPLALSAIVLGLRRRRR